MFKIYSGWSIRNAHIDAPIHFVEGGRWLDEIDLKDLLLPLYVIDKSKEVAVIQTLSWVNKIS